GSGRSTDEVVITQTYWDADIAGILTSEFGEAKTTSELQCPTAPGDVSCDPTIFADWDATVWNFGTSTDYPVLIHDSDNDGYSNEVDVDDDNNGLIEISTLQQLDLMRYDLAGTSLNGDSTGCPATGCNGYELVNDLDFDTNGNGVADAGDEFWNNGAGWEPIGVGYSDTFTANLRGNGHSLNNLWMNGGGYDDASLLGYISNNSVSELIFNSPVISGANVAVIAFDAYYSEISDVSVNNAVIIENGGHAGGIASIAENSSISDVFVSSNMSSSSRDGGWVGHGGLVGYSSSLTIERSEFQGEIDAGENYFAGGLVGFSEGNLNIRNSLVVGDVLYSRLATGGLVGASWYITELENSLFIGTLGGSGRILPIGVGSGRSTDEVVITQTYWDADIAGILTSEFGEAKTTSELQCPTVPGDVSCDPTIFADWDATVWDFGTSTDYPVLR
ncbi:MAG: hypothetical protein KBT77_00600, partial [Thalassolituus oleivorans]|nr:hypothetical protein [Thalassolituus oleivorans]